ncbi:hypothetical protein Mgra_00007102 [Meloidogyne graminicola]|uniref:Uncharacterized protein n=1 Tax=Meloidogyne graminicola TaxID=189291 RepID=A0A8S9ZJS8_9BILA|nr:hypothetical protein Mgra_00007102 [Meloidogyne graminicola]
MEKGESSKNGKVNRLEQIKECQNKLFVGEKFEKFYELDDKAKEEIIEHFMDINPEFKKDAKMVINHATMQQRYLMITETFMNGLCVLYLYGDLPTNYLFNYFKMDQSALIVRLHDNKIRLHSGKYKKKSYNLQLVKQIKSKLDEKINGKCPDKWELNGIVKYTSPLEGKKHVWEEMIEEGNNYVDAVYGNGNFHILISDGTILYDFKRELIWSFQCKIKSNRKKGAAGDEEKYASDAEKICGDKNIVEGLIQQVDENSRQEIGNGENSKKKINKFIEAYIKGKLQIVITKLEKVEKF